MSSNSPTVRLADLCEAIVDCEHRTAQLVDTGYPSIRTTDIKDGRIDFEGANRVDESTYIEWTQRLRPLPGDLILAREAPVGEVGIIPEGQEPCLGQRTVLLRPNTSKVVPRYLLYSLISPQMRHEMASRAEGCTVPHLNVADIRGLLVPAPPPMSEQVVIARTLGALDDKIELNRRMNCTLESIARAIFKSWFVDFEAPPSALGGGGAVAPKWPLVPFAHTVEILSGGTPRTSRPDFWGGGIPWYSVADAPSPGDVYVIRTEKTISDVGVDSSAAQVVPPLTTIISARGTVGKCALTGQATTFNQSCFGLRPANGLGSYYTYFSTLRVVDELRRSAHGSVFSTITRPTFNAVVVPLPPARLVSQFDNSVQPLMERILLNAHQSQSLQQTRDSLLSRLLSDHFCAAGTDDADSPPQKAPD